MIIEIIKIPDGAEPEFVRKEWKGLWLEAYTGFVNIGDVNFGCFVDSSQALSILKKKSPKAAEWYYSNISQEKINSFQFGPFAPDEYRIV